MTDQHLPDDLSIEDVGATREWLRQMKQGGLHLEDHLTPVVIRVMEALLPSLTLADMPYEEREECRWMQADDKPTGERVVILAPLWTKAIARVIRSTGQVSEVRADTLTPRPDLPRLEWPGDKKAAPALPGGWRLADHKDYGRVMVTNTTPNRDGYIYCVYSSDRDRTGFDWHYCDPDDLTYLDQEADTVPPNTLAVGSVWDDSDALTLACEKHGRAQIVVTDCDGDAYVWCTSIDGWAAERPYCGYEPFTIIYAGKKADQ